MVFTRSIILLQSHPSFLSSQRKTHLGLIGLLLGLLGLGLLSGLLALGLTDLGLLGAASADLVDGGTDNSTLMLNSAAGALLGGLLSDTLLVHAAEDNSPVDLTRVLTLEEEGGSLGADELVGPRVQTDIGLPVTGVDLVTGEGADFEPNNCEGREGRAREFEYELLINRLSS